MSIQYKDWERTDADTLQFVKQLDALRFEIRQYGMKRRVINLADFTIKQIEDCIQSYGYTHITDTANNVHELYDNGNQIIAECIFESSIYPS